MQTFGKILLRYRDKIGEGESGEENVRILPYRYRKVFSLDACFEGREWTLEVRFLGRVGRLCYRLYGGHRSFPRAVLARSARMERARSKITRMPHPRYTRTPDYILYLDPVLSYFCLFSTVRWTDPVQVFPRSTYFARVSNLCTYMSMDIFFSFG